MDELLQMIIDNIAIPLIGLFGTAIIVLAKKIGDRIVSSIQAKNKMSEIEKAFSLQNLLLQQLDSIVGSAVATNMQIADGVKSKGRKLTDEEASVLRETARKIVLSSLPTNVKIDDKDISIIDLIGGEERVNTLIDSFMEKHVYDYKLQKNSSDAKNKTSTNTNPTSIPIQMPRF